MPKDYARYPFKPRGRWLEQGWVKRLLIVFAGSLVIGTLGSGVYVWQTAGWNNPKVQGVLVQIKRLTHHQNKNSTIKVAKSSPEVIDEGPAVHFDFYTELPQMKVKAPDKITEIAAPPPTYFLEIGTYEDESTASERRLSLLLAGAEADVVKLADHGKMLFHLRQGPYISLSDAERAQQALKKKGIYSVLQKTTRPATTGFSV